MMFTSRYAIFVDAGYIFGQGALSFTGGKLARAQLRLNEAELINQLKSIAAAKSGSELLRIYWYDGTRGTMTFEQTTLAEMPDLKVRLGYINGAGQQKGVDSLIVTDLIELARNQAISDAHLVSGDGDLRVAVQIAQSFGVRVHLITLEPSNSSLNPQLRQEVDSKHEVPKTEVIKFLRVISAQASSVSIAAVASGATPQAIPINPGQVGSIPVSTATIQHESTITDATRRAITAVFANISGEDLAKIRAVQAGKTVPAEYDRKILGTVRTLLGRDLAPSERAEMRKIVIEWLHHQQ